MLNNKQREAIAILLKKELKNDIYKNKTPTEINAILHEPTITTIQTSVPIRITPTDVIKILSDKSRASIDTWPLTPNLFQAIAAQNIADITSLLSLRVASGAVEQTEVDNISKLFGKSQDRFERIVEPGLIHKLLCGKALRDAKIETIYQDGTHQEDEIVVDEKNRPIGFHKVGDPILANLSLPNALSDKDLEEVMAII